MKKSITILVLSFCLSKAYAPIIEGNSDEIYKEILQKQAELKKIEYEKEFNRFLDYLGFKESRNNWKVSNKYGFIGEWQMGKVTLRATGYGHITYKKFKKNPNIFPPDEQEKAVRKLLKLNMRHVSRMLDEYEGKCVNGIPITKAGLLAACHLGGARSVRVYLSSGGKINRRDAFGTSVEKYLKDFSRFNL